MLIGTTLGQTVTPEEVAAEIQGRGYYPLPATPAATPTAEWQTVSYSLTPPALTPPVTTTRISITYAPVLTLPVTPTPWPVTPEPVLPIREPVSLPVDLIEWTRIDPLPEPPVTEPVITWTRVVLTEPPVIDLPSLTLTPSDTEIPQFIVDEFPGWTTLQAQEGDPFRHPAFTEPPVTDFVPPWEPIYDEVSFDIFPEPITYPIPITEPPPVVVEKKGPWLLLIAAGALILLGGDKKKKPPEKPVDNSVERR